MSIIGLGRLPHIGVSLTAWLQDITRFKVLCKTELLPEVHL